MALGYKGLDAGEIEASRELNGSNKITEAKRQGFWKHFLREFNDPIIRVLLIAFACNAALAIHGGGFAETVGILFSILAATFVSTVSGYKAERTLDEMEKGASRRSVRVVRGGETAEIDPDDLVVGDVVILSAGERVPADGMLIEGSLYLDQSALNGESKEKSKIPGAGAYDPADPHALLRGSLVTAGEGKMYVGRVGDSTFYGKVSRELSVDSGEISPLKERLSRLARQISRIGYAAAFLIAAADFLYSFTLSGLRGAGAEEIVRELLHAVTLGVTVIVVAVPEGLPMMISVVLSANTRKMAKHGVLVRRPVGIETAGNMNILFCDKTGTLTRGKLHTEEFVTPDGASYRSLETLPAAYSELVRLSMVCNNQASPTRRGPVGGNSTDRALLAFCGSKTKAPDCLIRDRVPFDSARKFASVTLSGKNGITLIKGAPEVVLPECTASLGRDGLRRAVDLKKIRSDISARTKKAARILAFAVRYSDGAAVYIGFCSMRDAPRREALRSVEALERAGVRVVMLTGDSRETASAVARETGILKDSEEGVITSSELAEMSDDEAAAYLPRLRVLARALPSDKSRLVRLSDRAGFVCGMTGDGTNDAPALKAAPVGFAMGSGSEVAREAGDVVILDDNIYSITRALLYGRTIFHSIRKFIVFQLTMNFCAVGISLIAPFIGVENPVTVTQMLWINMIMDTLAGLAFAGETPREKYLRERPRPRGEGILCRSMISQILVSGVWTVAVSVFFLKSGTAASKYGGQTALLCGFFCFFVFAGVFAAINARTESAVLVSRLAANKPFIIIMAGIAAIQIALVYVGGPVFRCVPLDREQLAFAVVLASTVVPVDLIRKLFARLYG